MRLSYGLIATGRQFIGIRMAYENRNAPHGAGRMHMVRMSDRNSRILAQAG